MQYRQKTIAPFKKSEILRIRSKMDWRPNYVFNFEFYAKTWLKFDKEGSD